MPNNQETELCHNEGWDFLTAPDDTGAMVICRLCKKMEFIDIEYVEGFKKLFPDARILPLDENSGFLNKEQEREIWLNIISELTVDLLVHKKNIQNIVSGLMIKYKLFINT